MKNQKIVNRIAYTSLAVLLGLGGFFSYKTATASTYTYASVNYDNVEIPEDIDVSNLPSDKPSLVTLYEHGYNGSTSSVTLYAFVYDPLGLDLNLTACSIELSTNQEDYAKYPLLYCNRFGNIIKFKVGGSPRYVSRSYSVAGVELWSKGDRNAVDYNVGKTYKYAGSSSDLTVSENETIEITAHSTYYRSQSDGMVTVGADYRDTINSVYFTIPKDYLENYGAISRIRAEWYEFVTNNILVTNCPHFLNGDKYLIDSGSIRYIGDYAGGNWGYVFPQTLVGMSAGTYYEGWNCDKYFGQPGNREDSSSFGVDLYDERDNFYDQRAKLAYAFYSPTSNIINYDPHKTIAEMGGVDSDTLAEWIFGSDLYNLEYFGESDPGTYPTWSYLYQYALNHGGSSSLQDTYKTIGNKAVAYDLFRPDIQESRKMNNQNGIVQCGFDGKSVLDISTDDVYKIDKGTSSYDYSAFEKLIYSFMYGKDYTERDEKSVDPIVTVNLDRVLASNRNEIIDDYLIAADDVDEFVETVRDAKKNGDAVVLFRFAKTDYRTQNVKVFYKEGNNCPSCDNYESYVANETVFMDFDTISLTFGTGQHAVTFSVVQSPIDIVPGISPGDGMDFMGNNNYAIIIVLFVIAGLLGLGLYIYTKYYKGAIKK